MIGATATAAEMQDNFGRYLNMVMNGSEVIVTKNGKEVGRLVPKDAVISSLTDSLTGILSDAFPFEEELEKNLREKYEIAD